MPSKFSLTKKKLQSIWEDTDKRKELDREIQNSKEDIGEIAYISGLIAVGAGALTLLTGGAFAPITIPIMKVGLSIGVIANGTAAGECLNQVGIRLKSDDKWGATKAGGEGALYFLFMASDIEGLKGVSLMKDVAGKGEERVSAICEETVKVETRKITIEDLKKPLANRGITDYKIRVLENEGVKFTRKKLVEVYLESIDGKVYYLELGNPEKAGLEHIIKEHGKQLKEELGLSSNEEIANAIGNVLKFEPKVDFITPTGPTKIYEIAKEKYILLAHGDNGFIVNFYYMNGEDKFLKKLNQAIKIIKQN